MSDNKQQNDDVEALRAAGHDAAADLLEARAEARDSEARQRERSEELEELRRRQMSPAERDGHVVAERLRTSGVGQQWVSGGPLLSDRGDRR